GSGSSTCAKHARVVHDMSTPGLAPDLDWFLVVRRGQPTHLAEARAESARELLRPLVLRRDAMNDVGPAEVMHRVVDRRARRLEGVALSPRVAVQSPADFGAGPAIRVPGADAPDPPPRRLLDDREE